MTTALPNEARGFTLLEVLVVITIAGLILTVISGGLRFALTATGAEFRLTEHNEDLAVLDRVVRRVVGQATAGSILFSTPFHGAAHTMSFTTLLSGSPGIAAGGAADVAIGVDRGHRLILTWQPHYTAPLPGPHPSSLEVLAEAIDHVDIDYRAPLASGGRPAWTPDWTGDGLPDLVRLHLVPIRTPARNLPDIVAPTMLRDRT